MALRSSGGTTAYQPSPSIQPKYGFRYFGSSFAPATSPASIPPSQYTIPSYEAPVATPTPYTDSTPMTMGGDDNNESALASTQMSIDQANREINEANKGQDFGASAMYGPSPMSMIPGYGLFGPSVPTSGYGTPGTYSSITGGKFDEQGRSIDPISGYANPEYATMGAFANQIMDDPLGNILGDPKNAFDYDPNSKKMQEVQFAESKGLDTDKAATKALMDKGISEAQAQPGTATHDAALGIGYSDTGAAPKGSQYSKTGVFSSEPSSSTSVAESTGSAASVGGSQSGVYGGDMTDDNTDDSFDSYSGSTSATATAGQGQGTGTSYADDAQASDSGGGGK